MVKAALRGCVSTGSPHSEHIPQLPARRQCMTGGNMLCCCNVSEQRDGAGSEL